jgi:hypothetical protein
MGPPFRLLCPLATLLALATSPAPALASGPLAAGDAAWARRAEGHGGDGRARPEPVAEAVNAYAAALAAEPERLEAHWKLLRALHFAGDFASPDDAQARSAFERGAQAAEAAFETLRRRVPDLDALPPERVGAAFAPGERSDVARIHFWAAVTWGGWSRVHGLLGSVRRGVAGRLHHLARVVVALEPGLERGGAHRLLARLHATLPRLPLLSAWVDRAQALPEAERALAVDAVFVGNRLLLALTLLDLAPERRDEALRLLEEVAASEPAGEDVVEQLAIRRSASERLAAERSADTRVGAAGTAAGEQA